jgi:hypothetical protein
MPGGMLATAAPSAGELAGPYGAAYRVVFRLLGDAAAADVLARDALVYGGRWHLRHRRRSLEAAVCFRAATIALSDELWLGRPRGTAGSGFGEVTHRDERRRLRMAVRCLMGRERQLFVLEHLAGWPPARICAELGMAPQARRRLAERANRRMNHWLQLEVPADDAVASGAEAGSETVRGD